MRANRDFALIAERGERRDAAERRQRILDAARRLFATHTVQEVQMQEIAREAGVGQGTLYRRFRHKGELCVALITSNIAVLLQSLKALQEESGISVPERLRAMMLALTAFTAANADLLSEIDGTARGAASLFRGPFYAQIHTMFTTVIASGQTDGSLRDAGDAVFLADTVLAMLTIDAFQFQQNQRGLTQQQIVDRLLTLLQ